MGLNKQSGNMYTFVSHTWNPLGGRCPHNCGYCSTGSLRNRFPNLKDKYSGPPRIIESELISLGSGKFIFVCAQNDLFAENIPAEIIERILSHCREFPENRYLLQTKNPERILDYLEEIPDGSVIATTIESSRQYLEIMDDCPPPINRAVACHKIANYFSVMVTVEPVLDFNLELFSEILRLSRAYQINIGADSGNNNLPEPNKEKLARLIERIPEFASVNLKSNLRRITYPNYNKRYE
jgi:DNA repair photolyase